MMTRYAPCARVEAPSDRGAGSDAKALVVLRAPVTPIPANIAQPLIKGLTNEVVVHDDTARRLFSKFQLLDYATSVRLASEKIKRRGGETFWTDALTSSHRGKAPVALLTKEGLIIERRQRTLAAPVEACSSSATWQSSRE